MEINNFELKKKKSIFVDGEVNTVEFLYCGDTVEYIAIIENGKVKDFVRKTFDGGSKKVYKIPAWMQKVMEYFNNNPYDTIVDYTK